LRYSKQGRFNPVSKFRGLYRQGKLSLQEFSYPPSHFIIMAQEDSVRRIGIAAERGHLAWVGRLDNKLIKYHLMAVGATQGESKEGWELMVHHLAHRQRQKRWRLLTIMTKWEAVNDALARYGRDYCRRLAGIQETMGEMGAWKPGWRSVLGEIRPHLWVVPGTPAIV
jgi:hypothetical protein